MIHVHFEEDEVIVVLDSLRFVYRHNSHPQLNNAIQRIETIVSLEYTPLYYGPF